ncbi:hypothetical protein EJ02DRAFT_457651 [Clathrospora elynae]|uniref:Uncharacterized protein n=1 Tax=Clathrospora elynae TaxID=706981 RepID=A0A6A5SDI0_9PLEO|nr:hypothetical protein EJ02DRAFT_457651 [Clathrospora elynae]
MPNYTTQNNTANHTSGQYHLNLTNCTHYHHHPIPSLQQAQLNTTHPSNPYPHTNLSQNHDSVEYRAFTGFFIVGILIAVLFPIAATAPFWIPYLRGKRGVKRGIGDCEGKQRAVEEAYIRLSDVAKPDRVVLPLRRGV